MRPHALAISRLSFVVAACCSFVFSGCSGGMNGGDGRIGAASLAIGVPGAVAPLLPAPAASALTLSEVPLASDALADSVGINGHVPTLYLQSDFAIDVALFQNLGIRYAREGIVENQPSYDAALVQFLGTHAKLDGIASCPGIAQVSADITTSTSMQSFQAAIGGRIAAVESPNEADGSGDPTWVADLKTCLPSLRSTFPGVPLIAPSLANPNGTASALGDVSSLVDLGNIHRYFGGHNPGTTGYGSTYACGAYGALAWAICLARINSGSKPIVVTETGYNSQTEVDESTQAKYLSRTLLVNLAAGIPHTFIYDLKDYVGGDAFGGDGLVRVNDTVKPAYLAIKNEIAAFSDPGVTKTFPALNYSLSNAGLDHLLFRKRDGTYILALWNETTSWNTTSNTPMIVVPQSETIGFTNAPSSVSAQTISSTGLLVPGLPIVNGHTITLPVDDHVTLLHFSL